FEIPHNALTVVTGVSGSGKSSLAFDTIYAEGSGAMWNRCQRMRGNFLSGLRNLTQIILKASLRRLRFARRIRPETRALLSAQQPKSMIICDCCSREWAERTAPSAARK